MVVRRILKVMLLAWVVWAVPGCVPLGWVIPPAQIQAGAAAELHLDEQGDYRRLEYSFPMRAGVYPLQSSASLLDRPVDIGAGYEFVPTTRRGFLDQHGPYLDLAYLRSDELPPLRLLIDGLDVDRLTLRGRANLLLSSRHTGVAGVSGTAQLAWEWFSHSDGDIGGCQGSSQGGVAMLCGVGYAYGETAYGFYVEGTYGRFADHQRYWLGAGLLVRLPVSYGAGFLFALSDSWL
jgi:hypothetical protein